MSDLVSIIVPVYKGEAFIKKTVKTILSQEYKNIELLLINDGSPDESGSIIDRIAISDKRVKVFHKENGGVAEARNFGIERAKGEFVAFCDQDDLWMPSKLIKQIPLFDNNDTGVVYCGAEALYTLENKTIPPKFNEACKGSVFEVLLNKNVITCCTVVVRKSLLNHVKAFDSDRSLMGVDDWLAWLKLSLHCQFDFVAECLATHIFHGSNYSSNEQEMYKAELVCMEKIKPIAEQYSAKQKVNYQKILKSIHLRYAEAFIYNGDFSLGGEALLLAATGDNNLRIKSKGTFLLYCPSVLLHAMQNVKRLISNKK